MKYRAPLIILSAVSWIVFAVDTVSKETRNAGLAEIAVFRD